MSDRIVHNFFLSCLCCLLLPLWCGCVTTQCCCFPAAQEDDLKDLPPDFPRDSIVETNRDLDVAIIGEGFFQCHDWFTGEIFYTRAGHFNVNEYWELTLGNVFYSRKIEPLIWLPPNTERVQINDDGMVWAWVTQNGGVQTRQEIGQIELATFSNPEGLLQVGENLYRETKASGWAMVNTPGTNGLGKLKTGYLEVLPVVPEDREKEFVDWIRDAAEQGNAEAQWELSWFYQSGTGVLQDEAEAVKRLRKAAEQGHVEATKQLRETE